MELRHEIVFLESCRSGRRCRGCHFGDILGRQGQDVTLIARPAQGAGISANGLRLETTRFGEMVGLAAGTAAAAVQQANLILFCVKSLDTEAAGALMRLHLQSHALVLCLQNGADNTERLRSVLPKARSWRMMSRRR